MGGFGVHEFIHQRSSRLETTAISDRSQSRESKAPGPCPSPMANGLLDSRLLAIRPRLAAELINRNREESTMNQSKHCEPASKARKCLEGLAAQLASPATPFD